MTRRDLFRRTAGAAAMAVGAGIAGSVAAQEQIPVPGAGEGARLPFRKPLGALDYLDQKQYISNMEIISFLPGPAISSGEPLMAMFARGKQRLLPGGGGWVDISDPKKPVAVPQTVKGTNAKAGGCIVYNTRLKKWLALSTASAPLFSSYPNGSDDPVLRKQYENFKGLRGVRTWDITDPTAPILLQEYSTGAKGMGTHMNFYDGGKYAYLEASWDDQLRSENIGRMNSHGVMIMDMTDPANIKEVARWWVPGQRFGEEEDYKKYPFAGDHMSWTSNHGAITVPKRVEDGGTIGYSGFGAFGLFIFDLTDITKPKPLSQTIYEFETRGGIPFHTCYPVIPDPTKPQLSNLLIGVPETIYPNCREEYKGPYVVDVKDPRNPRIIAKFPKPPAPKDAPYNDFCMADGRFGSHNCQCWIAPGTSRSHLFSCAWFVAGARLFDLTDPRNPKEVAWFVPKRDGDINKYETWWRGTSEGTFVEWDRNLIWLGTHHGTYCLSSPALGKPVLEPRKVEKWTIPHANVGWDDATPKVAYLGRGLSQLG